VLYTVSSHTGPCCILGNANLGAPQHPQPGVQRALFLRHHTTPEAGARRAPRYAERVRVVALYLKLGGEGARDGSMLVQVARSRANREELARRILLDTALPCRR
jgi:two-component system sensor histidine kinase TctE